MHIGEHSVSSLNGTLQKKAPGRTEDETLLCALRKGPLLPVARKNPSPPPPGRSMNIYLMQALVFLASFLIFQVELMLGKVLLPSFGGGHLVWGVSLVFYQCLLFFGYCYVHLLCRSMSFVNFQRLQTWLIALSLLILPANLTRLSHPSYAMPMVAEIVWLLFSTIGLLFFILSSLAVYTQAHLQNSRLPEKGNPYRLYAGSNVGAFAGLLSYPFLVEPAWDIDQQFILWQCLYGALAGLFFFMQWRIPLERAEKPKEKKIPPPATRVLACWFLLSAAGCAIFLAVTNQLLLKVPPVPFVWIIPLTLYLLSFVLVFKSRPFCPKYLQNRWVLLMALAVVLFLSGKAGFSLSTFFSTMASFVGGTPNLPWLFLEPLIWVFFCAVICLVVHYNLAKARPEAPGHMTTYYLVMSLGGFIGGALVNWVAPMLFNESMEILVALALATLGLSLSQPARVVSRRALLTITPWAYLLLFACAPYLFPTLGVDNPLGAAAFLALATFALFFILQEHYRQITLALVGVLLLLPLWAPLKEGRVILKERSFYGTYKVVDEGGFRKMKHGLVLHGAQSLDLEEKDTPLTYYHEASPLGAFLDRNPLGSSHIAFLGLGTGSLAVYARPGDRYDFLEIDPLVGAIALNQFSFLDTSQAKIRLIYGDARISLRRMNEKLYDALIVDVFNGDTVPVHLLTLEALEEYRQRLHSHGVMFFHISNQYLNLMPIITAGAHHEGLIPLVNFSMASNPPEKSGTLWMALTTSEGTARTLEGKLGWRRLPANDSKPWTDRHSSLFSLIEF